MSYMLPTSRASLSKCLSCSVSSRRRSRSDHNSSRALRVPRSLSKVDSTAAVLAASVSPDDLRQNEIIDNKLWKTYLIIFL